MGKNPVTKIASVLASVMLFVLLWGAIAAVGWGGAGSDEATDPAAVAVPEAAAPAPAPTAPQVTIKRTVVVRRIHQADGSTDASGAPPPAAAPAPAAPPPQPAPQPAPAPAPNAKPAPVTKTKGS